MLDILTWMWFDPHLEGSRAPRERYHDKPAQIRPDLIALEARRARQRAARGLPPIAKPPAQGFATPKGPGQPRFFKPEHVIRLAQLFAEHLTVPHRFVCIVDELPEGFTSVSHGVHWLQTPTKALEMANLRSPEGNRFPSCYRRLWSQSKEAAEVLSERVLLTDIDALPVGNMDPVVNRPEPFVGWRPYRDWGRQKRIGGGIYLFTPGANASVWDEFYADPRSSIAAARNAGFRGSDQAWLSFKLAHKVPVYGLEAGIYSIRDFGTSPLLPIDARIVQMNGPAAMKPWSYVGPARWVAEHWRGR